MRRGPGAAGAGAGNVSDPTRCKEMMPIPGTFRGTSQCTRRASTPAGFCKQHDPQTINTRREASSRKWNANFVAQQARHARELKRAEFATECAKWLGEGAALLTSSTLYTGDGPEDQTFGDVAREILK